MEYFELDKESCWPAQWKNNMSECRLLFDGLWLTIMRRQYSSTGKNFLDHDATGREHLSDTFRNQQKLLTLSGSLKMKRNLDFNVQMMLGNQMQPMLAWAFNLHVS